MLPPAPNRPRMEDLSAEQRLNGWKDIANYLGRGERTVKRWEADRGLPTHRVPGAGRPSVFAYAGELNEWLKSGGDDAMAAEASDADLAPDAVDPAVGLVSNADESEPNAMSSAAVSAESSSLQSSRAFPYRKRRWLIAACGLVVVGIAVGASSRAILRRHLVQEPASLKPDAPLRSSVPMSDAEKLTAHDLYLKGRYEWEQRTPDSLHRALDDFTQSIVHDSENAQAYSGLADTYDLLRQYSAMPDSEAFPRAIVAAPRAIKLDDSLEEAHRSLAFAEMYGTWDFKAADVEFQRAIQLDPKDPIARRWYANALAIPGRYGEALKQIDIAQELDPSSSATLADKGWMLFIAGRTKEAVALLQEVERSAPGFRSSHFYLMFINLDQRNYVDYLAEGQITAKIGDDPVLADIIASARAGYARARDKGLLEALYSKQEQYYREGKVWGTMLARTCLLMDRREEALKLLEDAYAHHETYVFVSFTDPVFSVLKDEPRYQALLKKINFPSV